MRITGAVLAAFVLSATAEASVPPEYALNTVTSGEGEAVVIVPGFVGSAYSYRRLTPLLTEAGYRSVVIEPLGIGDSPRPRNADYSLTAQADRVARTMEKLGMEQAIFVAQGVAASVVLRLAVRRPDLVRGVVSIEGGPAEAVTTPAFRRAMRFAPLLKLLGGTKKIRSELRKGLIESSGDPAWVTETAVDGYAAGSVRDLERTLNAFAGMAEAREPERLVPLLGRIRCPMELLIGGAPHKGSIPPEEVQILRRELLQFRAYTVPGTGHFIAEERPRTVASAVIRISRILETATAEVVTTQDR